ncbi:hypothetical protein J6590_003455 [Homalodisca vitripennis]|nr:hypothetical protein J6590_003455 [Homalodisca vitripennis]
MTYSVFWTRRELHGQGRGEPWQMADIACCGVSVSVSCRDEPELLLFRETGPLYLPRRAAPCNPPLATVKISCNAILYSCYLRLERPLDQYVRPNYPFSLQSPLGGDL